MVSSSKVTGSQAYGPELLGKTSAASEGQRILSQLEHGVPPLAASAPHTTRSVKRYMLVAALGLSLAVAAVLIMFATQQEAALPVPRQAITVASHLPAAPIHTPVQTPMPAPATIVNEVAHTPPSTTAAAPEKAPVRKVATSERQAASSRPAPATSSDKDVALLTAMVAHAHQQDSGQDRGRAEHARDVVVRKDEEETASLLQRCKQLGLIEGMLCRARICSGRWDSDPACH